jgi:hypothetical protein
VAGLTLSTGDRLLAVLETTPIGPRWRAEAPGGGVSEVLLVEPLRDELPREPAARLLDASTALQHPQLRPVRRAALDGTRAVFAYDPADGVGLAPWLAREAPHGVTSLTQARELFDQVCQAVAVVHRGGLAHGGVAPWSVHLVARGAQVIARVDAVGAALLAPPVGVDRLAPELDPRTFTVSPRADVFALGMLLGAILLGEEAPAARVSTRLDESRADLDDSLRALVRACLADDPEARPADAARLRELVRRAVWTPRAAPPPPRAAPRAAEPSPFERAPPARPAPTPLPPPAPPELDDHTEAVRAPPPSHVVDADPTAFVAAPPPDDDPPREYAATLRTPRRAPREDRTRAIAAPPPDAPREHTRHVFAPPPDAPAPAVMDPPAPTDDDDWGGSRSSFHVIAAPPVAPAWSAPASLAPPAPTPFAPLPVSPARPRTNLASLVIASLVTAVFLAAMLIAWTR